jgi:hypothetical protein
MIVRIQKKQHRYTILDNTGLQDPRLSFKAKGILAYLLTKPDNWEVSLPELIQASSDGEHTVQTGLKELQAQGYAKLVPIRGDRGRVTGRRWIIFECPELAADPSGSASPTGKEAEPPKRQFSDHRKNRRSVKPTVGKVPPLVITEKEVNTDPIVRTEGEKNAHARGKPGTAEKEKKGITPPVAAAPPLSPVMQLFRESPWFPGGEDAWHQALVARDVANSWVDTHYYYQLCLNWSDGKYQRRVDWLAQGAQFINEDRAAGKLKSIPLTAPSLYGNTSQPGSAPFLDVERAHARAERVLRNRSPHNRL